MNEEKGLLNEDQRADVLNAINEVIEKFGLVACGYDDTDGVFFNVILMQI